VPLTKLIYVIRRIAVVARMFVAASSLLSANRPQLLLAFGVCMFCIV